MATFLSVLNVGEGDIRFDNEKPEDVEKAKSVIEDMLRRGYAVFANVWPPSR